MVIRRTEPGAVVGDRDGQRGFAVVYGHLAVPRAGVPDRVGDGLDHDAVRGDLDGGRKRGQVIPGVHAGGEASARGQPLDGLGARAGQAELVQGRRPQPLDEAPDVDDRAADLLAEVVQLS